MRSIILSALTLAAVSACANAPDMSPVNARLTLAPTPHPAGKALEGDVIALAFSGGGARSAAFSYGALLGLREMRTPAGDRLIDRVALVTAVSGGAVTAAWFGQHGPDGLDGFRAALNKDWASRLRTSWMSPGNWRRLMDGGMNGRDRLGDWLDREVFAGGVMGDLSSRPRILINATDLFTGAPFAFAEPWFEALCSDLSTVRIADAVAASMAVPLAFRPTVIASYGSDCAAPQALWIEAAVRDRSAPVIVRETARALQAYRDPERMKYLHLVDGGVVDNFGLAGLATLRRASGLPHAPFTSQEAVGLRRLTVIVVNAEMMTSGDWALDETGPNGAETIAAALENSIKAAKRNALDAFAGQLTLWEREMMDWRCGLSRDASNALGARPGWTCADLDSVLDVISFADLASDQSGRLGSMPTEVSLPSGLLDDLIDGGRRAVTGNAALLALTTGLPMTATR
ncbi:MAG: patatin-like phospholipase family protein [Alphaproteobacteria bacterium]|nr:patatin-like phospholipase family protein [Alphaproteobacteria bacterium]